MGPPADSVCLSVAADAQLHNTGDLVNALALEAPRAGFSSPDLILAAYRKWGEDCPAHLLGEFAFAIWDAGKRRLFCCRDQLGIRPFLYWSDQSRFAFGGDIRKLLRVPGVKRELNRRKLAAMAIPNGHHFYHEETYHEGIKSLPGGSCLTIDVQGIRQWTYWKPGIVAQAIPVREDEVYDALREIVLESVRCRLPCIGQPAAHLSGGLDSSTVVGSAAHVLAGSGRTLTALAGVLPSHGNTQLRDESEFIDEFRTYPNVRIEHIAPEPGAGPFDLIQQPAEFEDTPMRTASDYVYAALEKAAAEAGATTVLGGVGGELGATSWATPYYLQLAVNFRWSALRRELRMRKAHTSGSPIRFLAGQVLDWIRPFRSHGDLVILAPDFRPTPEVRAVFRERTLDLRQHETTLLQMWLRKHAARPPHLGPGRVNLVNPLLDRRILEFSLAVPGRLKVRDGYQRCLARFALKGIMPDKIRRRTSKTPFSPDYFVRYNGTLDKARDFVAAIRDNDPVRSIVNVAALRRLLEPVDPLKGTFAARISVPVTIYLICFLRQFAEFSP